MFSNDDEFPWQAKFVGGPFDGEEDNVRSLIDRLALLYDGWDLLIVPADVTCSCCEWAVYRLDDQDGMTGTYVFGELDLTDVNSERERELMHA